MKAFPRQLLVESRAGSLGVIFGQATAISGKDHLDTALWKQVVGEIAARNPETLLHVAYCGSANLISGYRLYYTLECAKRSGITRIVLHTDGGFWITEASRWLVESGVDEIVLTRPLPDRAAEIEALKREQQVTKPVITVETGRDRRPSESYPCRFALEVATVNWLGEMMACPFDLAKGATMHQIKGSTISEAWNDRSIACNDEHAGSGFNRLAGRRYQRQCWEGFWKWIS